MTNLMKKIIELYKKYREAVHYLIFGVVTTVVNFVIYYILLALKMHYLWAQALAWAGAVIVAYITNRRWVFTSRAHGVVPICLELCSFVASRIFSGAVETGLLWVLVDLLHVSEGIAKFPVAVITVVLNYVTGKWLVFRK